MDKKIRILIAKPGLDGHDRGAKVIARALRDAGMEVIYTGLRQTPEMIAEAALQEDVDAVGLSILSGAHLTLLPRVVVLLESNGAWTMCLIFAGGIIPDEDVAALEGRWCRRRLWAWHQHRSRRRVHSWPIPNCLKRSPALVDRALQGDRRALSRLISRVENGGPEAWSALALIYPRTGRAQIVGVTGAPGTGKSTLVSEIAKYTRQHHPEIDRRHRRGRSDFAVFRRGGAGRSHSHARSGRRRRRVHPLDGDARQSGRPGARHDRCREGAGRGGLSDLILIETVGAGQSEIDIARTADTVIVVEAPGLGDEVQAIKAGILEIADILVVNKADRDGVQSTVNALHAMLDLGKAPTSVLHHGRLMTIAAPPSVHRLSAGVRRS